MFTTIIEATAEVGIISINHLPDSGGDGSDFSIKYTNWSNKDDLFIPYLDRTELADIRDAITRLLDITEDGEGDES